ncbi:MAG TPA: P63C domain-containing protein [Chitinophagaceae bacterium]|nr:P63C domain-containing protein [Chitinophagaceae bacterium]
MPKATHAGNISIGDIVIECYNLDNGQRVMSRISFLRALGRTGKAKGGRKYDDEFKKPVFLTANNLTPFISNELLENSKPIQFIDLNGSQAIGYKAELLPSTCYVFIDAQEKKALKQNQIHIAERAKILVRGFAIIGIIALIDEATGYQDTRKRDALQKIFDKYLRKEYAAWAQRFPIEFYEELFRLKGWNLDKKTMKMPGVVGRYTNDIIYDRLAPGILEELRRKNPVIEETGRRQTKHHQWLTEDIGHPALDRHFVGVMALMRVNNNWDQFKKMIEKAYPKIGTQLALKLFEDDRND